MNVIILTTTVNKTTNRSATTGTICMMLDEQWTCCGRPVSERDERTERRPTCLKGCRDIWDSEHPPRPLD